MEYIAQKSSARTSVKPVWYYLLRMAGFLATATGMGCVAYLISQGYDGLFAAALASALTSVSVYALRR